MGCCIGARTSQAEAGDQEFQSGQRYHSLTEMGFIKSSLKVIQTMATSDMDIINNNNNNNIYIVCLHAIGRVGLEQARDSYEIVFTVSTFVFGVHYYMYDLIFPCSYMSDL